ncbi:aminopeptidase N [Fulvimonas soli]|uniref:Aminopeptidase N n=1 Tax=Fulvimonas soli TaxID=155197 RepID=A0A316HUX2_9GAMM|nr:aminopeptidase N [Fulvimonas soli]PWK82108.1 alanyl aminopeptidase [Fulvimonas soli]TNY27021.1 aminopeptidase N [Fulvimonas soli]
MPARNDAAPLPIRLRDYAPPPWRVVQAELDFELGIDASEVGARLHLARDPAQDAPLRLDGEELELLAIALDGAPLPAGRWRYADGVLEVDGARDGSVLETRVRVRPAENTALEGLYLSGSREAGFLLTQCEAEGFRRITFFPDRPDVLARFTVTLRADRARFPVLLAGGNPDGAGELPGGRHWARFVDPHPKPSYLFALVAGRLEKIERDYRTADGRAVKLAIWSEADAIGRCRYALGALERAMRWDEETYGRNYDLDVFHVVATHDFNMGAMENKGLNIFNAKYLLADPDTTTDDEYRAVEAVVAHEYFHNWSGNRVTCRDWFQLSLKEGLTVFREQQFSARMNSPALKRIEDVALLRRAQFPEDAGPLAHPVRPAEYREINNFYTATVYEKGAELVRMLAGRLGEAGFRRGMDLYFARHDGRAATLEDFLAALGEANGLDLSPYLAWYAQAGTPRLTARGRHDAAARTYTLTLAQHTPPTPGQPDKRPLPIPVKLALFDRAGRMLPLRLDGQTSAASTERVVVLAQAEQDFVFRGVDAPPVPSLLRGFSAPVILECDYAPEELALLLAHDPDGFNRWEAGQQLALRAYAALRDGGGEAAVEGWCAALAALFDDAALDPALLADLLTPPGEIELAEREREVDPARIHALRQELQRRLAAALGGERLERHHRKLAADAGAQPDAAAQARRRLKRRVLELLALHDPAAALPLAQRQYESAAGMTDRLAALAVLVRHEAPQALNALAAFRARHAQDPLALDKWFAVQAQIPGEPALARVRALEADPAFTLKNPNRVRALLGSYASGNPSGFHRADGAGYRLLAERLAQLDALNPQVAARLATAFNGWQRLEPVRREQARQALAALAGHGALSRNLAEIVGHLLPA